MSFMFRSPNDPSSSSTAASEDGHVSEVQTNPNRNEDVQIPGNPVLGHLGSSVPDAPRDLARVTSGSSMRLSNFTNAQAQSMLYISMLYDLCRKEALKSLNSRRGPENQASEHDEEVLALAEQIYSQLPPGVAQNIDLPDDLKTGSQAASFRSEYLSGFSNLVGSVAAVNLDGITQSVTSRETALSATNLPSPALNARLGGPPLAFNINQTSVFNPYTGPNHFLTMGGSQASFTNSKSQYQSDYQELELLGKGGYGQVYKVRNHLDSQEYAIKKILITSQRLQKSLEKNQIEALLAEVRTLAKLSHTNIVRYFHGWVETTPVTITMVSAPTRRVETLETMTSGFEGTEDDSRSDISDRMMPDDFGSGMDFGGGQGMQQLLEEAQDRQEYEDDVVFGYSSRSGHSQLRNRRAIHATTSSGRTPRTSMLSVVDDDDEDIETIPRVSIEEHHSSFSRAGRATVPNTLSVTPKLQDQYNGPDVTLFIKMSLHPTTLAAYLSPDQTPTAGLESIRHCFHSEASLGMLRAILNGMEYLHSQNIVHRDLKPANIFLSIHTSNSPPLEGCFDIMACKQCTIGDAGKERSKSVYITPCIGDFGLIAEMDMATQIESASTQQTFEPSPLAAVQPKLVGTHFYRPATMPTEEPRICPRLDVYSLGVITLELVHRFGTKSERAMVLTNLNKGILPKDFENHEMAAGISAMVREDRDERWHCSDIRKWIAELRKS